MNHHGTKAHLFGVACITFLAGSSVFPNISHAKDFINNKSLWKTECVGRYQISVPGEVEIALHSLNYFYKREIRASFSDNSFAEWGNGAFLIGSIGISPLISEGEFKKYSDEFTHPKNKEILGQPITDNDTEGFKRSWPKHLGVGFANGADVSFYKKNRIYRYEVHGKVLPSIAERDNFLVNFAPRNLYEIPAEEGICFPYGFVKGRHRDIRMGVTMRLLEHPDVEILFRDANAEDDSNFKAEFKGSRGHVENFWGQYAPSLGNVLEGTRFTHYHDVKLGRFTGVFAFATIARPDQGSEATAPRDVLLSGESEEEYHTRIKREIAEKRHPLDYGYMAFFKGDPKAGEDSPDLKLYVIRTASRAMAVGKKPVTEEELKSMAEQVAASIKLRPTIN